MAPEVINEDPNYNEKVDVYSFGVMIYFMLSCGEMPVTNLGNIANGKKANIPSCFNEFSRNLIDKCWNFNPNDRPSFDEICNQIKINQGRLFNFSQIEINELINLIKQHESKIPSC